MEDVRLLQCGNQSASVDLVRRWAEQNILRIPQMNISAHAPRLNVFRYSGQIQHMSPDYVVFGQLRPHLKHWHADPARLWFRFTIAGYRLALRRKVSTGSYETWVRSYQNQVVLKLDRWRSILTRWITSSLCRLNRIDGFGVSLDPEALDTCAHMRAALASPNAGRTLDPAWRKPVVRHAMTSRTPARWTGVVFGAERSERSGIGSFEQPLAGMPCITSGECRLPVSSANRQDSPAPQAD
jgi:hypothetical protein